MLNTLIGDARQHKHNRGCVINWNILSTLFTAVNVTRLLVNNCHVSRRSLRSTPYHVLWAGEQYTSPPTSRTLLPHTKSLWCYVIWDIVRGSQYTHDFAPQPCHRERSQSLEKDKLLIPDACHAHTQLPAITPDHASHVLSACKQNDWEA